MKHQRNEHKDYLQKETKKLERESQKYWDSSLNQDDVEWVPLDHPFQSGYFFTLSINEETIRTLPENIEKLLRDIHPYVVSEFVSMEKRPSWKKSWDVVEDLIITYRKKQGSKDLERVEGHFFNWIPASKRDKDGAIIPYSYYNQKDRDFFFSNLAPFMTLKSWVDTSWKGDKFTSYAYVLAPKWRKYFQFRRYERWITHKAKKDGTLDSRKHWIDNKLFNRDFMWYKYDDKHNRDNTWDSEGRSIKEKALKKYHERQIEELD